MPKISVNAGHTPKAQGAVGHLNEVTEDRAVHAALTKYLIQAGWEAHDSTTNEATSNADLSTICKKANGSGAGYFISIHFNSGGGTGVEVYYSPTSRSSWGKNMATKVSAALAKLMGIRNRGAKAQNYYVLKNTNMPAILVEVCFVDSSADAAAYRRVGADAIGKTIAECITGKTLGSPTPAKKPVVTVKPKGDHKPGGTTVFRIYNPNTGEHFFTTHISEKENLAKAGWKAEGTAWHTPASGKPIYRLVNPWTGFHMFTADANEKANLEKAGWYYEGVAAWNGTGGKPVYRVYNPNAGQHHFTTNVTERDNLVKAGWKNEGTAFRTA